MELGENIYSAWIDNAGNTGVNGAENALFPWWSFSKTAIAICALTLVDRGKMSLDSLVVGRPYSLRNLLGHTAGIREYGPLLAYQNAVVASGDVWPDEALFRAVNVDDLLFDPGDGWSYSNVGYLIVRRMIEQVTGQDIGAVIHDMICAPLGLTSVKLAQNPDDFRALLWDGGGYNPAWAFHGCLMGNMADAALVLHSLCNSELLPGNMRDAMFLRRVLPYKTPGRPWVETGYGLGVMMGAVSNVGTAIGHSGCGPFSACSVYHFPDLPTPITVASFCHGPNEAPAENETVRIMTKYGGVNTA